MGGRDLKPKHDPLHTYGTSGQAAGKAGDQTGIEYCE